MTFREIARYFNRRYPVAKAEKWDRCGLHFGKPQTVVRAVVVALDLTPAVLEVAKKKAANLIIVHHPFLFNSTLDEDMREGPHKAAMLARLIATKTALLVLHTNYDKVTKRMATVIAQALGLEPKPTSSAYGHLFTKPITAVKLRKLLMDRIGLAVEKSNLETGRTYHKWGLLPGAGAPADIALLHREGAEFVVASDIKWSTWVTATSANFKLVQVSHAIEDLFTSDVAATLKSQWKELQVITSPVLRS